jgi:hypothetical protein
MKQKKNLIYDAAYLFKFLLHNPRPKFLMRRNIIASEKRELTPTIIFTINNTLQLICKFAVRFFIFTKNCDNASSIHIIIFKSTKIMKFVSTNFSFLFYWNCGIMHGLMCVVLEKTFICQIQFLIPVNLKLIAFFNWNETGN